MKRAATILELLIGVVGCLGIAVTSWVNINSRITMLETQMKYEQEQKAEIKNDLKEIKSTTTAILIQLQNKIDKQ